MEKYKSIVIETIKALKSVEWAGELDDVCWECCLFCRGVESGPDCRINVYSSACCRRGVNSCEIDHEKTGHLPSYKFVEFLVWAEANFP